MRNLTTVTASSWLQNEILQYELNICRLRWIAPPNWQHISGFYWQLNFTILLCNCAAGVIIIENE